MARRHTLVVTLLVIVAACGGSDSRVADEATVLPVGAPPLDLAARPQILFQIFGDRSEPRMMPIAAVTGGAIRPIGLTRAGWRELDSAYLASGAKYPIYVNDQEEGAATVTRGMWHGQDQPLYPLPGCRDLRPLAAVTLDLRISSADPTVELIASSTPLARHEPWKGRLPAAEEVERLGRAVGHAVGQRNEMDEQELDSLDFSARMVITGATKHPTLVVAFIDPQAGDLGPGMGHTSHLLAFADRIDTGYVATYRHAASGDAKLVEFQRIVDHLDVDNDGIDEIILEAWHYGGENELVVLNFRAGQWHEVLRSSQRWCLDPQKKEER
jgi:hypothetical protein